MKFTTFLLLLIDLYSIFMAD